MRKPSVLHVVDSLTAASGVARVVMCCVTGIPSIAQDVVVYDTCDRDMKQTVAAHGGNVYCIPPVTASWGRPFSRAFSQLLRCQRYTIVHGHLLNSAFLYLREAKRQGIPGRIIHAHSAASADSFIKRVRNDALAAGIVRWANRCLAVSQPAAWNAYRKRIAQAIVIYNGINPACFQYDPEARQEARKELGLPKDIFCVGNVARFVGLKNHRFLLDVFCEIRKKKKCVLALVGDGPTQKNDESKSPGAGAV